MEGGTNRSYGIQVARIAGVPEEVIVRAGEILRNMEQGELDEAGMPKLARGRKTPRSTDGQLSLFTDQRQALLDELRGLDPEKMTPLEALGWLAAWRQRLVGG